MTTIHPPVPFDPADWATYSFGADGSVEVVILDEEERIAASFTAERALQLGMFVIQLAHDIHNTQCAEDGAPTGLAHLLREAGVGTTKDMHEALMRRQLRRHPNVDEALRDLDG